MFYIILLIFSKALIYELYFLKHLYIIFNQL